jgi:hypothetical protein
MASAANITLRIQVKLDVPPEVRDALIALGWTPPCTCPDVDVTPPGKEPGSEHVKARVVLGAT